MDCRKAFQILDARIGIISNREALTEFKGGIANLSTDFNQVKEIEYTSNLDGYFYLIQDDVEPFIHLEGNRLTVIGDLIKYEEEGSDDRFSLLGNEGLFYRFVLRVLEDRYKIFSYHACSLYDEETELLYVICGGAGSGKTAFILRGLEMGLKIFSTEMTHFNFQQSIDQLKFHKGSLKDNIRIGNLKFDFPQLAKESGIELPEVEDVWGTKMVVDFSKQQTSFEVLEDPELIIVFPHVEQEKKETIVNDVTNKNSIRKKLFDNLSDKPGETILIDEGIPVIGLDTREALKQRLIAVDQFLEYGRIKKTVSVVAGTKNCLNGLKE
jgi:hypothetical protein